MARLRVALTLLAARGAAETPCGPSSLRGAALLPRPAFFTQGNATLDVSGVTIILGPREQRSPVLVAAAARFSTGGDYAVAVRLSRDPDGATIPQLADMGAGEAYALEATANGATIDAETPWGALRGLETFSQTVVGDCVAGLPLSVEDRPRYAWRGLLLDTARRFYPVAALARFLDAMETAKLNVLHWHASDAESFPVAIGGWEEKGAFSPASVYSAEDVRAVVAHAAARGIRVLPEFDTPAHAGGLSLGGPDVFCGADYSAVVDPTAAGLEKWLDGLYGGARALFPEAMLHVGGDEVSTTCWNASNRVQRWLQRRPNTSVDDLFALYERDAAAAARRAGFSNVVAWDEVFTQTDALDPARDIVHAWNGPGGSPVASDPNLVAAVAAGFRAVTRAGGVGFKAVPSSTRAEGGRRSHGYYLTAGDGVDADVVVEWQHIYDRDPSAFTNSSLVLGAEAALWGVELDPAMVNAVAWPRAAVLGERLWAPNETFTPGDYSEIMPRLQVHRCRLLALGVGGTPLDGKDGLERRDPWFQCTNVV